LTGYTELAKKYNFTLEEVEEYRGHVEFIKSIHFKRQKNIAPQAVTATASSSGGSLAMEHFEAAQRKGVSASALSYTGFIGFLKTPERIYRRLRRLTSPRPLTGRRRR
jgi:hypothetical protein